MKRLLIATVLFISCLTNVSSMHRVQQKKDLLKLWFDQVQKDLNKSVVGLDLATLCDRTRDSLTQKLLDACGSSLSQYQHDRDEIFSYKQRIIHAVLWPLVLLRFGHDALAINVSSDVVIILLEEFFAEEGFDTIWSRINNKPPMDFAHVQRFYDETKQIVNKKEFPQCSSRSEIDDDVYEKRYCFCDSCRVFFGYIFFVGAAFVELARVFMQP